MRLINHFLAIKSLFVILSFFCLCDCYLSFFVYYLCVCLLNMQKISHWNHCSFCMESSLPPLLFLSSSLFLSLFLSLSLSLSFSLTLSLSLYLFIYLSTYLLFAPLFFLFVLSIPLNNCGPC